MKRNKLGFTLVELLSVVLIIGILTAIGLPQYRKSVSRAEAMEAMVNLRAIFDAARRYRAANSESPLQLKGLDVTFFDATSITDANFSIGRFDYTFETNDIKACRNSDYCFYAYYNHNTQGKNTLTCKTLDPNGKYGWLCEAIGTTHLGDNEYLLDR